jgi:hypothetical protein
MIPAVVVDHLAVLPCALPPFDEELVDVKATLSITENPRALGKSDIHCC